MAARRQPAVPGAHLIREAEAISAGAVAVFLALSFLSLSPDAPPAHPGGPGAFLLLAVVLVVALVLATGVSAVEASGRAARWLAAAARAGAARLGRRPGAAEEPAAAPRRPKLPVLLDDALEPPPEARAD